MNVPPSRSQARLIFVNNEPYEIMGEVVGYDIAGGSFVESGWGRLLIRETGGTDPSHPSGEVKEYAYPLSFDLREGMRISGSLASADGTYALTDLEVQPEPQIAPLAQPVFPVRQFEAASTAVLRITPRLNRMRSERSSGNGVNDGGERCDQLELIAC